jgi:hypothetical protein
MSSGFRLVGSQDCYVFPCKITCHDFSPLNSDENFVLAGTERRIGIASMPADTPRLIVIDEALECALLPLRRVI